MIEQLDLQHIITRLFRDIDDHNWTAIKARLSNQVEVDYSSITGNPRITFTNEELVQEWKSINGSFTSTHHMLSNFHVAINENRAKVFLYALASHYLVDAEGDVWTVYGTYDFHFEREGSLWIITSIVFHFKFEGGNTSLLEKSDQFLRPL